MNRKALLALALLALLPAIGALANALKNHPSPYLALHGDDPVQWRAWGPEAVKQARRENKLLFISSGYFACHWCHVMQRESYQNAEIAAVLNAGFIPVKVDRELQAALDAYLIDFVQNTQGRAGWPLNVFLTPEGLPIVGALYMPPPDFLAFLNKLSGLWRSNREELERIAKDLSTALAPRPATKPERLRLERVKRFEAALVEQALALGDDISGGFGQVARFPSSPQLNVLLKTLSTTPNAQLAELLRLTLDQMANQGLRDHLGGGFFRYTTDPLWQIPHFEKMLYDNALLAEVYLNAAVLFDEPGYAAVARDTLDFMLREMRANGAFIASLSAVDEAGVEGGYYLWRKETLKALLDDGEYTLIHALWSLDKRSDLAAGYLPIRAIPVTQAADQLNLTLAEAEARLASARAKLLAARSERSRPRDGKQLAAWNGLALHALARAASLSNGETYRTAAREVRDFLAETLWDGQSLSRAYSPNGAFGDAGLEDYAFVADGLLAWAEMSGTDTDYALARAIAEQAWVRFRTERGWRLGEDNLIPYGPAEPLLADTPMPSPTAVLLRISFKLAKRANNMRHYTRALTVLTENHEALQTSPFYYATHIAVLAEELAR